MFTFSRENITMFLVVLCIFGIMYLFREFQKLKAVPPPSQPSNIPSAHEFMMMRQAQAQTKAPSPPAPVPVVTEVPKEKKDDNVEE